MKTKMQNFSIIGMAVCLLMTNVARAEARRYAFTEIASLEGSPFVSYFEPAAVTVNGQVLFAPALSAGGEGVFLRRHGQLTAIAQGGQTMPDGGVLGYTLSPVSMNVPGDVAFIMTRDGIDNVPSPVGLNAGVYRYNPRTGVVPVMIPGIVPKGNGFLGSAFIAAINNRGDIVFPGMVCSTARNSVADSPSCTDTDNNLGVLALGVYKSDGEGRISAVVKPGDAVPGSRSATFDFARGPGLNNAGDVAFTAHVFGEPCATNPTQNGLFCAESLYVKRAATGVIESIAHRGEISPVSGKMYSSAYGPVLNAAGDVAFTADLSGDGSGSDVAVLLYSRGKTTVIAKSGDTMPGGGTFATGGFFAHDAYMNDVGDIAFDGTLSNGDNGLYVWHGGTLELVAKTGTDTGFGTISTLDDFGGGVANTQIAINDAGDILFAAQFKDGGGALIVASRRD